MADGKKIEIRIAATGGEQAAAELRKVDAAMGTLDAGSTKATAGLQGLVKEAPRVSAAGLNMRSTVSNVGYQIQDFAVQVGMGTSAVRAFSQQAPQLLSAFGPWGIVAGTAIALGAPLASALMASGDAAAKSSDKVVTFTDVLADYKQAAQEAAQARDVAGLEQWFDALDSEEQQISDTNAQREKEIELLIKTRALKEGVDKAQRDLERATIAADPNLSDQEKIRRTAEVDVREKRAAADARIRDLLDEVDRANRDVQAANEKVRRQEQDVQAAAEERANAEALAARNRERVEAAARDIPRLQKELDAARSAQARDAFSPDGAPTPANPEREARIADLEARIKALQSIAPSPQEAERIAARDQALTDAAAKKEQQQREQAEEARREAQRAAAARDLAGRALTDQKPLIEEEFQRRSSQIGVETDAALRAQQLREQEKQRREDERQKRKDEQERRDSLRDQLAGPEDGLDADARSRGLNVRRRGLQTGNKTLQDVGKALADGTNEAELQKLGDMVREASAKNGAAMTQALLKLIADLNSQAQQIEQIKSQIRKGNR